MKGIYLSAVAAAVGLWCGAAVGDVTIRGRVTDQDGNPVCGALVFWLGRPPINSYPPSIDGKADVNGEFELTSVGEEATKEIRGQSVLIYAEGHGLGITTVEALLGQATERVAVRLPAETKTEFRIVDPEGHVLAGELVEPVMYVDRGVAKLPETFVQAVGRITDDTGLVRFPAFTSERLRTVRVVSQTFGPQQLDRRSAQLTLEETIRLRAAGRVEVSFDTSSGQMGKCKMLAFTTFTEPNDGPIPFVQQGPLQGAYAEFLDNPQGLEIPALASGLLRFQLSGVTNQERVLPHWPEKTELTAGATRKFVVPLEKTVAVHGRVVDRATEMPCANVDVLVYTRYAGCSILTRTDDDGYYRCNVLRGPACVSAHRLDLANRVLSGSSTLVERVVGPEGLEFPDLILTPRSVATK